MPPFGGIKGAGPAPFNLPQLALVDWGRFPVATLAKPTQQLVLRKRYTYEYNVSSRDRCTTHLGIEICKGGWGWGVRWEPQD